MLTWQKPLTSLLGVDKDEVVVVTVGDWVHRRFMQTKDKKVTFEQVREEDGEWLLADFHEPEEDDWWSAAKLATKMGLLVPETEWLGPLESIPEELLESDKPLQVRRVDKSGWINLRKTVKARCKGEA